MTNVAIIGAGYVGLVTGTCLAELGHDVTCVEIDQDRLARLRRGESPIHEPGLTELMASGVAQGRLRFTGDYAEAIPAAEIVFLAVPTPSLPDGSADTSYVFAAAHAILDYAGPDLVISTKSTVPVGTGDEIEAIAAARGARGVRVAANPEFLREGSAVRDFMQPDRIVIGAETPGTQETVAALYAGIAAPIIRCSRRSAELAKYAANAMLATRVSFMNEIARICEATGADVLAIKEIVGTDPRIGPAFLQAGVGWGGSCLPKDVRALAATAAAEGWHAPILSAVSEINVRQRERAFGALCAAAAMDAARPGTVGVLGLAFKPNTDDIREGPALDVIARLLEEGITVRAHDPVAIENARRFLPRVQYCEDAYDVARGCDALFLATEWRDYLQLDWHRIGALMRGRTVLDGRNVLDPRVLAAAALVHLGFGRSPALHTASCPPAAFSHNGDGHSFAGARRGR